MRLKVEHVTSFEYDTPIYETATEVRLQPSDDRYAPQRCLSFVLTVDPAANIFQYTDFYGNSVHHFNLLQSHRNVIITATSVVETGLGRTEARPDEDILLQDYLTESPYIRFDPALAEFAQPFERPQEAELLAEAICRQINQSFIYEPGVTDVGSTSTAAMQLGRGVCQDFAHIMIASCRYLGLPTRYVSGYLYGGAETDGHDRSSHAWGEVYCGPEKGWLAFDPTHKSLTVDERYIKIGAGRDYSDVSPVRGTYKGQAQEHLKVTVRISAVKADALV